VSGNGKGYATACVGKWHLGFGNERKPDWNQELKPGPLEVGFDYFFGLPVVNSHPPFVYVENRRIVGLDPSDPLIYKRGGKTHSRDGYKGKHATPPANMASLIGGKAAHELYGDEHVGEKLTQKALSWMNQQAQPFFLYYASHNVHLPITPHPYFHGKSDCGLRGDFVQELDWSVGQIIAAVERFGAWENTLFVFTSDNGAIKSREQEEVQESGHSPNGKLKGKKFGAWEGGHRVPFIASWPNKIPAGSTSDALIANLDLLPTFAAITDQQLTPREARDGFNQLPFFLEDGGVSARDELIIMPHKRSHTSLRLGGWVYIPGAGDGGWTKATKGELSRQLYNLKDDPFQNNNRIADSPERADAMATRLKAMLEERGVTTKTPPVKKNKKGKNR
jgi:arylsulfatase A-like enzyme